MDEIRFPPFIVRPRPTSFVLSLPALDGIFLNGLYIWTRAEGVDNNQNRTHLVTSKQEHAKILYGIRGTWDYMSSCKPNKDTKLKHCDDLWSEMDPLYISRKCLLSCHLIIKAIFTSLRDEASGRCKVKTSPGIVNCWIVSTKRSAHVQNSVFTNYLLINKVGHIHKTSDYVFPIYHEIKTALYY